MYFLIQLKLWTKCIVFYHQICISVTFEIIFIRWKKKILRFGLWFFLFHLSIFWGGAWGIACLTTSRCVFSIFICLWFLFSSFFLLLPVLRQRIWTKIKEHLFNINFLMCFIQLRVNLVHKFLKKISSNPSMLIYQFFNVKFFNVHVIFGFKWLLEYLNHTCNVDFIA